MTIKQAIVLCLLALAAGASLATERQKHNFPAPSQSQTATAGSAYSGVSGDSSMWVLPSTGAPSYAGAYSVCTKGRGIFWNFAWSWDPDLECIELIARLDHLKATPVPVVPPQIMTQPACSAKAKPVKPKATANECKK